MNAKKKYLENDSGIEARHAVEQQPGCHRAQFGMVAAKQVRHNQLKTLWN